MMTWLATLMLLAPFEAPAPVACAGRHDVALRAADVVLACVSVYTGCSGDLVAVIENCGAAPVEMASLALRYDPNGSGPTWQLSEGEFVVPPGQRRAFRRSLQFEGRVTIEATLKGRAGVLRTRAEIKNPALEAAMADCRACGGDWRVQNELIPFLGCRCRAKDAGRVCHSRCDCEGTCDGLDEKHRSGKCSRYQGGKGCIACPPRSAR